jgi:type I restriction enzyme S subunit
MELVPKHWIVEPFKRQIDRNDGGVWGDDPDGLNDTVVLRSTEQTVDGHWRLDDPAQRKLTQHEINSGQLMEGDLLLTKSSGSSLHIGKTTLVTSEIGAMRCCYSNFMQRIRMRASFLPRLAWYVLNSDLARRQFDLLSNSTTGLVNLNGTIIGQIVVPVAPRDEQTLITGFLDRETAKIDVLVAEQWRLIDLLKEKRQAVISRAVMKGLDLDVRMKPSGIDWLGTVPAHWGTRTIAQASTKITNGYVGPTRDILVETGVPYIQATHIKSGRINFDDGYFVTRKWSAKHAKSVLAFEDVLIVQTGAGTGDIGLVEETEVGFNCHALIIVTTDRAVLSGAFLAVVLQSTYGEQKLESIQTGAMHPHLNCGEVKFIEVPIPPIAEQSDIVSYVRMAADRFDALAADARRAIDLLQERRSALISAAVTGQIDVRALVESTAP